MASDTSVNWWKDRWSSDVNPPWHLAQRNPNFVRHRLHLIDEAKSPQESGIILVPMCGKCVDMKFLYEEGFHVVGVECAEKPVRDFFVENKIEYVCKADDRIGDVYSTADGRLRIIRGDVLKLSRDIIGGAVDMVWDRGALAAVDKELRKGYANVMSGLVKSGGRYLVDTLHYNDWYTSRPPRNVPPKLIECLFEEHFDVKLLEETEIEDSRFGVSPVYKHIHLMTAKGE